MEQAIAIREKRTPDELITEGQAQAKALMRVVKEAGLSKDLGGSKPYLEVEAWQTVGRFNGFLTDIAWTKPIIEGGQKVGYEARAELVRIDDGVHMIGAEACCFFDEEIEKKDGTIVRRWDSDSAVKSMAQTRAQAKLGRMAFAWVAVLAGYSGTPAEEMEGVKGRGKSVVFPFGKHKDQEPSALDLADLHRELAFWQKKTAEEANPRYKANNERLVKAIQETIAEKSAKVESPAAQAGEPVTAGGNVGSPSPAGDLSELEKAWVRVEELREAAGWTKARLTKHIHDGFPESKGDGTNLSLLNVGAIITHLSTQQPSLKV